MYNLPYYKEHDETVIEEFIRKYPFAFITGCDAESNPVATQIPIFLENINGRKVMRGHMMKNTDHHQAFASNEQVLVVFSGPQTYVSGSWYSNPHIPSTWNYMSVHMKGKIRFLDDDALEDVLRMTSLHFEDGNAESPTVFDNVPAEFKKMVMGAIVAFEIEVTDTDTVFKLSQDRDADSYRNIITKLREKDENGRLIASEMEKRAKALFPDY